jgi:hypothetical protein
MSDDPTTDQDPAEGGDVGPPAADTAGDDDLVASEGVNETADEDSPGASIAEPGGSDAEPNEPG